MTLAGLIGSRRFLPLFLTQAIGAFTDNAMKSAFAFLITFGGLDLLGLGDKLALMAGSAAFILPFLLFSGWAGAVSDAHDKARIVRATRATEIGLAALAALAMLGGWSMLMLVVLFGYGTQSAFFGPSKYAILPQHLPTSSLLFANALFESSTFVAILAGTLFGGLLAGAGRTDIVAGSLVALAILSYLASRYVPPAGSAAPVDRRELANPLAAVRRALAAVADKPAVIGATLGISWFWALGLVVLTVFPDVARGTLGVTSEVANGLIAAFVVGIAIGSMLAARLLKGVISARHVPMAAFAMALFFVWLAFATDIYGRLHGGRTGIGIGDFLTEGSGLAVAAAMVGLAAAGGVFTVPLYAILQARSEPEIRSSAIAGNNVVNSLAMVAMLAVVSTAIAAGAGIRAIFIALGIANAAVAAYAMVRATSER